MSAARMAAIICIYAGLFTALSLSIGLTLGSRAQVAVMTPMIFLTAFPLGVWPAHKRRGS